MKIYYGWYIVAISILSLTIAVGGSIQAFGLFVIPASEAFNLSRAEVNTGAILLNVGMAFMGPVVGRMLDKSSARLIAIASALLFGASLVILSRSHNIWLSAAVIAVPLAIAASGCGTMTSPALVARWFLAHRARAMAIAMLGLSLGPIILIPIISHLISAFGWRDALAIVGIAGGLILFLLALLVRDHPGENDREPNSGDHTAPENDVPGEPMTLGQVLSLPRFWTVALGTALAFGIMQAIIVSLVPFGQGEGLTLSASAVLISVYGASAIAGAMLLAWVGDRFSRMKVLCVLIGVLALVAASPILAQGYTMLMVCTVLIGLVCGAITPAFLALLADIFGPASFGTVNGAASFLSTIVSAAYIRVAGEIFDRTGSYQMMFLSFLFCGLIAFLLVIFTGVLDRRAHLAAEA